MLWSWAAAPAASWQGLQAKPDLDFAAKLAGCEVLCAWLAGCLRRELKRKERLEKEMRDLRASLEARQQEIRDKQVAVQQSAEHVSKLQVGRWAGMQRRHCLVRGVVRWSYAIVKQVQRKKRDGEGGTRSCRGAWQCARVVGAASAEGMPPCHTFPMWEIAQHRLCPCWPAAERRRSSRTRS